MAAGAAAVPHRLHGRSQEIYDVLQAAGIIREGDHVRRVIIDISVDAAVVCYIERYPDSRVLELIPVLGDGRAEIRWAPEPPGTSADRTLEESGNRTLTSPNTWSG